MKRVVILLLVLLVSAMPVLAQTPTPTPTRTPTLRATAIPRDCGNGLPCGALPWRLPVFPALRSPTPFPTVIVQNTATRTNTPGGPTATATRTNTPTATLRPTDGYDVEDLENQIATLNAVIDATQIPINVSGTAITIDSQIATLSSGSTTLFGYIRGVQSIYLGPFAPLFTLFITGVGLTLLLKITHFIVPLIALLFGFIRKVIQLVLDFIPG